MTIEGMNALYAETFRKECKLSDYVKLKEQKLFWLATKFDMDSVFIKRPIFDKPDDLLAADIMSHR